MNFFKENLKAIRFLLVFIGVYLALNTLYGFYTRSYLPTSDPITRSVAKQAVWVLSFFDYSITQYHSGFDEYIAIANDRENMIYVYEGCNGINVIIVYISFLLAFTGDRINFIKFTIGGVMAIHVSNLIRIALLYGVAFYFPDQLYFVHKYFFTGAIYLIVFVLWFFWVKRVSPKVSHAQEK